MRQDLEKRDEPDKSKKAIYILKVHHLLINRDKTQT